MTSLSINNLQSILYELNQTHPNLNKIGRITKEGRWNYYVNSLCHQSQPRLAVLVQKVNQALAVLEQKGVKFFDPSVQDAEFLEKANQYRARYQIYMDTAQAIGNQIEALGTICPELKQAYHELKCREIGLRFSLGADNGGLDSLEEPDQDLLDSVTPLAQEWKKKQKFAVDKELDELQLEQLGEMAKYPEWLEIVMENPDYLDEVFSWTLHNFQSVEVIVKNYETRRRIKAALLPPNLGYARNILLTGPQDEVLAYKTVPTKVEHVFKRVLTASIYHGDNFKEFDPALQERVNIQNPAETIHFKQGNYTLTVEEFLKELGQKNKREANVSLCADWGFVNFHPVKGVWNADLQKYEMPPMTEEDWTDYVPPTRIASHAELCEQYGEEEIEGRDFFFKVMATRKSEDLNALDCHAFLQIFMRMEDGNWKVLNIGLYAFRFHQGIIDGLQLFCATLKRVVCLLDQNAYYTHRQRSAYPVFCSEEAKEDVLKRIFKLMQASGVFQMSGYNCAFGIQELMESLVNDQIIDEKLPNFYKMPVTLSKTGVGPLDRLLNWAHHQWEWVRWLVVTFIHSLFFSHRTLRIEDEDYSVKDYFSKNGHVIYNPSYLPWQISHAKKTGKGDFVKGELYWGHTDEKKYQRAALLTKMQEDEEEGDSPHPKVWAFNE